MLVHVICFWAFTEFEYYQQRICSERIHLWKDVLSLQQLLSIIFHHHHIWKLLHFIYMKPSLSDIFTYQSLARPQMSSYVYSTFVTCTDALVTTF
jgi:hypothetical protein